MSAFISKMLQQADRVVHSKNSVLVPLQWLVAILVFFFIALIVVKAPIWALIGGGVSFATVLLLSMAAYIYFGIKAPDCLRSEEYSLSKLAIQHGLYGDSESGMIEGLPTVSTSNKKLQMESRSQEP